MGFFLNLNLFNIIIFVSVGKYFVKLMVKMLSFNVIRKYYLKYVCYDNLVFDKYFNILIFFVLKVMYWYLFFMVLIFFLFLVKRLKLEKCIFILSGFYIEKIFGLFSFFKLINMLICLKKNLIKNINWC